MKGFANWIRRLYANSGTVSKFVVAIVMAVQVNIHTGWTNPTGIVTDVLAFAVWLVPNSVVAAKSAAPVTDSVTAQKAAAYDALQAPR